MLSTRILLIAFLLSIPADACMWVDGTTLDGGTRTIGGLSPAKMLRLSLNSSPEDKLDELIEARREDHKDADTWSELEGVRKVITGDYDQAITIFNESEAKFPGRYSTAVNLGTAYELKGELNLALKWISEGIRRNPDSHMGTEWLHVEILKARMKLKENPDYLREHHVIELPESFSATSSFKIDGDSHTGDDVRDALEYQLRERMIFVKPPDPIVADLLFTFGQVEGRTNVVESGMQLMEMAREYGFPNPELIAEATKQYEWAFTLRKTRRIIYIILAISALAAFLILAYRKEWFFLTGAAHRRHQMEKKNQRLAS
ncbi:MAG: hypothetical protein ABIS50_03970 [Luteolibacter sp.]|uniref:hypothetical protein n=1 Tax=Luteolibacter sp. TaxID=1962973 RepID=UPI003262D158